MRFKATIAALALSSTAALAADYSALRGSQMAPTTGYTPSVAPSSQDANWEGFYIGAFAGYSHAKNNGSGSVVDLVRQAFRFTAALNEMQVDRWPANMSAGPTRSVNFGLFGGYNVMADELVLGIDLQAGAFNHKSTATDAIGRAMSLSTGYVESVTLNSTMKRTIDNYFTARVRVGQAMGNFLPYIAGGIAVARGSNVTTLTYRHSGVDADPATAPALPPFDTGFVTVSSANRNAYAFGYSAAIGSDFMFGGNMFGRVELSHSRFATSNINAEITKLNAGLGVKF
ncbi:MAG: outer membrane protein [Beijerinckiaceae bacterium]